MSETFTIVINDQLTDVADLKVAQLKVELKKRGISTTGNKQELVDKLKNFLSKQLDEQNLKTSLKNSSDKQQLTIEQENDKIPHVLQKNIIQIDLLNHPKVLQEPVHVQEIIQIADKTETKPGSDFKSTKNETNNIQHITSLTTTEVEPVNTGIPEANLNNMLKNCETMSESVQTHTKEDSQSKTSAQNETAESALAVIPEENPNILKNSEAINEIMLTSIVLDSESQNPTIVENELDEYVASRRDSPERSESGIKEIPMSGDRNRFSRSKSPKPRWQCDSETTQSKTEVNIEGDPIELNDEHSSDSEKKSNEFSEVLLSHETNTKEGLINRNNEIPKIHRKRKWLTDDAANILTHKKQLTISSETLKSYIPTISLKDDNSEPLVIFPNTEGLNSAVKESNPVDVQVNDTQENSYEKRISNRHLTRTVILEYDAKIDISSKPATNVLHIFNLTRPFTLNQFKELLSKYGSLKKSEKSNEDFFWINSVKSHCYVAFENEKSAHLARDGLHNTIWPQSNPKQLQVEFASMDELIQHISADKSITVAAPTTQQSLKQKLESNDIENENIQKEDEPIKNENSQKAKTEQENTKNGNKIVREWDIPKFSSNEIIEDSKNYKEHRKNDVENHDKSEHRKKTKLEEAPKTLDDLFKKTKSLPHIYWLPLTEQQFIQRQKENEKRMLDRMKRAECRLKETAKTNAEKEVEFEKNATDKSTFSDEARQNETRVYNKSVEDSHEMRFRKNKENSRDHEINKYSQNKANDSGEASNKNNHFSAVKRHSKRLSSEPKSSDSETSTSRFIKKIP